MILLPQPPKLLGVQVHATHPANFVFLVEIGFHHVGQAGLEPLTSGDPPSLAFQSAGVSYQPPYLAESIFFFKFLIFLQIPGLIRTYFEEKRSQTSGCSQE